MLTRDHNTGVWMMDNERCESAARHLAIRALVAMDLDPNDFRLRDKVIMATADTLNRMLDDAQASARVASHGVGWGG